MGEFSKIMCKISATYITYLFTHITRITSRHVIFNHAVNMQFFGIAMWNACRKYCCRVNFEIFWAHTEFHRTQIHCDTEVTSLWTYTMQIISAFKTVDDLSHVTLPLPCHKTAYLLTAELLDLPASSLAKRLLLAYPVPYLMSSITTVALYGVSAFSVNIQSHHVLNKISGGHCRHDVQPPQMYNHPVWYLTALLSLSR